MNKKKRFWTTIMILALLALIAVLGYLAWYMYQDYLARQHAQEVQETVSVSSVIKEEPEVEEESEAVSEIPEEDLGKEGEATEVPDSIFVDLENPIDFAALKEINPELYAWIQVDDTQINYPIAQRANDDGFYLHHDMYGDAVFAGCLYTESVNSTDWTDPLTIIYGHNMRNQTMFYDLHKFESQEFFDSHPYFYIYSQDNIRVYEVFAAFTYDDRRTLEYFNLDDPEVFQSYIDGVKTGTLDGWQGGHVRQETQVDANSRIVTLQTCVGAGGELRYLVQGVLVSEGGKVVNAENE
ncbi:MAG: class B sortase [Lachnospiraceae bacterium]|nr:class B sortase [Lachnospiraceae bacterium]